MKQNHEGVMKKLALFAVATAFGLSVLKAGNLTTVPPGYTSVHIRMMLLEQGATNTDARTTEFHFKNQQIGDDDILGLINDEFGTTYSVINGDQLALSNFWDGTFSVLDKNGNVLLADASANTNGDQYRLYFHSAGTVFSGSEATNHAGIFSVTDGSLHYRSGDGTNIFHLAGFTTVRDDSYDHDTNSTESFELTGGIGALSFPDYGLSGVLTGTAFGRGKDSAPTP